MWMAIQLTICAIFLAIAAYWVGRFFGKRKYLKLHEEMKALELSFNQLIEEMELASNHNMKVVEKQSEELSELLTIADKKILRVNDFLHELDETTNQLKRKASLTGNAEGDPGSERKLRQEINLAVENIHQQLESFSRRLLEFESQFEDRAEVSAEVDYSLVKNIVEEEVSRQISRQLDFFEQQLEPVSMPREVVSEKTSQRKEQLSPIAISGQEFDDNEFFPQQSLPEEAQELHTEDYEEQIRMPIRKIMHKARVKEDFPELKAGSPVHEVLRLAEAGVSMPQIARTMGMGKAQIELILKMYGSGINMRNVV